MDRTQVQLEHLSRIFTQYVDNKACQYPFDIRYPFKTGFLSAVIEELIMSGDKGIIDWIEQRIMTDEQKEMNKPIKYKKH